MAKSLRRECTEYRAARRGVTGDFYEEIRGVGSVGPSDVKGFVGGVLKVLFRHSGKSLAGFP